jgi:glucose-fructose oxidoreductase
MATRKKGPVRFAVVGLGYFAQVAILPAFRHAPNARLVALVSDDPVKRRELSRKYRVEKTFDYAEYEACLKEVDAVYIALPNDMHREYVVRAARRGVHVLCEKPLAVTEAACRAMIAAARRGKVLLMTAYRLHLNAANLRAVTHIRRGAIGEPRLFNSVFTMQVGRSNIRTELERGGGTLYDIGVYCINAARYLFGAEPEEVSAFTATRPDPRFREVEEMTAAVLRFPGDRLASFTVSFGAKDTGDYLVAGTKGLLRLQDAYEYAQGHTLTLDSGRKPRKETFPKTDQMGAEIRYFADCVRTGKNPEPSGAEGLADVRIVQALYRSARTRRPVRLGPFSKASRPKAGQAKRVPPIRKPRLIRVKPASR